MVLVETKYLLIKRKMLLQLEHIVSTAIHLVKSLLSAVSEQGIGQLL